MASDSASVSGKSKEEKAAKRAQRNAAKEPVDVAALEQRVHIAELRAREVEAELRYSAAMAKRREMKSEKRGKGRQGKSAKD